ncbi:MAG: Type 1 glutamine amidotransferase-like domain-containing protein [Thermoanaerobaculia bacterium]
MGRVEGDGWLVLIGGGEFSFGETLEADRAWLAKSPEGPIGFLPTASGSADYPRHFAAYLAEEHRRESELIPIYRERDARRGKNLERIAAVACVYIGGGVTDQLLDTLRDTPAGAALLDRLGSGGTVVAIGAAAQALGAMTRSLYGGGAIPGLGWLRHGGVETNFDPGHDRRLRQLLRQPAVRWGLGLPAGSALLLGPQGETEIVGMAFALDDPDGDLQVLTQGVETL